LATFPVFGQKQLLCVYRFGSLFFCRKTIGEKADCKILVKSTQCLSFISILEADFCMKVFCTAFLKLQFVFVIFSQKNIEEFLFFL